MGMYLFRREFGQFRNGLHFYLHPFVGASYDFITCLTIRDFYTIATEDYMLLATSLPNLGLLDIQAACPFTLRPPSALALSDVHINW